MLPGRKSLQAGCTGRQTQSAVIGEVVASGIQLNSRLYPTALDSTGQPIFPIPDFRDQTHQNGCAAEPLMGTKTRRTNREPRYRHTLRRGCLSATFTMVSRHFNDRRNPSIRTYQPLYRRFRQRRHGLRRAAARKREQLTQHYGLACRITGVASRRLGWLTAPNGFDPEKLLAGDFSQGEPASGYSRMVEGWAPPTRCLRPARLMRQTGQPAVDYLRAALEMGASRHQRQQGSGGACLSRTDMPWPRRPVGRRFLFESAVMDGVPIFSLFREAMPAVEVRGFRGVLNSTTNVILEGMEAGMTFDDAIRQGAGSSVSRNPIRPTTSKAWMPP